MGGQGSGRRAKTEQEMLSDLEARRPDVEYISGYVNYGTKATFRCKSCGNEWAVTPHAVLRGSGCPECAKRNRAARATITAEDFKHRIATLYPAGYEIVGDYRGMAEEVTFRCPNGHERVIRAESLVSKNRLRLCPICNPKTQDDITEDMLQNEYIDEKLSVSQIAKRHGRSTAYVQKRMAAYGIAMRAETKPPTLDVEELRDLYVTQGLPVNEVAARLGCSVPTIYKHIKKNGIPRRNRKLDSASMPVATEPTKHTEPSETSVPAHQEPADCNPVCEPTNVRAFVLEHSVEGAQTCTSSSKLLAIQHSEAPAELLACDIAKGDWLLQRCPSLESHPDTFISNSQLASMGFPKQFLSDGHGCEMTPECAAFLGMTIPCKVPIGGKSLDQSTVLLVAEPKNHVTLEDVLAKIVEPGSKEFGVALTETTTRHYGQRNYMRFISHDPSSVGLFDAMHGEPGMRLFRHVLGMPQPISSALVYGTLLATVTVGSRASSEKTNLFMQMVIPDPRFIQPMTEFMWSVGKVPSEKIRNQGVRYLVLYDMEATKEFLRGNLGRPVGDVAQGFVDAMSRPMGNLRQGIVPYDGQRYVSRRVMRAYDGVVSPADEDIRLVPAGSLEEMSEIGLCEGHLVIGARISQMSLADDDHRSRKAIQHDQHLDGSFVSKRSLDKPSKTYIRRPLPKPTGDVAPAHSVALLDGRSQIVTPTGGCTMDMLAEGDAVLDGNGNVTTVTRITRHDVDEDFVDLLTHHLGHVGVAQDTLLRILPGQGRDFATETFDESLPNSHIMHYPPVPMAQAEWHAASEVRRPVWVPVPDGRQAVGLSEDRMMPTMSENLPAYDFADFLDGKNPSLFWSDEDNVYWKCNASFKAKIYDGIRPTAVAEAMGISKDKLRNFRSGVIGRTGKTARHPDGRSLREAISEYLCPYGLTYEQWDQMFESPVTYVMPRKVKVTPELAYLIGFYVADGTVLAGRGVGFALDSSKPDEINRVEAAMGKCFPFVRGFKTRQYKQAGDEPEGRAVFYHFSNPLLADLFATIVPQKLYDKQVPEWMMHLPDNLTIALLQGLVDGDGSVKNNRVSYVSVSEKLAFQVRSLLMRFDTPCRCAYARKRQANGKETDVWEDSGPSTQFAVDYLYASPQARRSTTLADKDGQYVIASFQRSQPYHLCGTAYSIELADGDGNTADSVTTTAGIIRIRTDNEVV